jgi:periplasmic protein TonB
MLITDTRSTHQKFMFAAALPALLITFLLFALMQQLISSDLEVIRSRTITLDDSVGQPRQDSTLNTKVRHLPEPPKPTPRPEPQTQEVIADPGPWVALPTAALLPRIEPAGAAAFTVMDKSASAVVRIDPKYPPEAARDGIEGWVKLSFSVDQSGAVTDVVVLDAQPKRIFDREAIKALKSWKYQPQIQQGKAVMQRNMQVQLDFSLDKA